MHLPPACRPALLSLFLALAAGGCSAPAFLSFPPQVRGNRVGADELKQLVPGTSTRADAAAALGSPTAKATFDDNTWIYIGEVTKPVIGGTQEILKQDVVLLKFDAGGVLREIERRNEDDSKQVAIVSRATPSPGSEANFFQQLFGNVGKFGPGGTAGGGGASGGSNRSGTLGY